MNPPDVPKMKEAIALRSIVELLYTIEFSAETSGALLRDPKLALLS